MYSHIDLFFKLISVLLHDIFLHVFVLAITYLINNKHAADIVIGDTTSASGAGTNLKVGGASIRGKAPEKKFGRAPPLFFGSKSTTSRFGERFRDGKYSLVRFLFAVLLLTVPPVPSHL